MGSPYEVKDMVKLALGFLIIISMVILFAPSVLSQSFFGEPNNNPPDTPKSRSIISPKDFGSLVDAMDKKTKSNLSQEASKQLHSKQAPPNASLKLGPPSPDATAVSPAAPPMTPTPTPSMPSPSAPSAAPPPPTVAPSVSTPPPQIPEPDVYTGFGNGGPKSDKSNPNPPADNSGGWNITY